MAITNALAPHIQAEKKQRKLIEARKLRMDRLEVMILDHGKELDFLKERVTAMEKTNSGSEVTWAIKANIDYL